MKQRVDNRLYPNLVRGVCLALEQVFEQRRYTDSVLEKLFYQNKKWGSRDRAFIAESTYELVRGWRKWWAAAGMEISTDEKQLWKLFGVYWLLKGETLPTDWLEFNGLATKEEYEHRLENITERKILLSVSDELDTYGYEAMGENWQKELSAMNHQAAIVLRTNTLKTTLPELRKLLFEKYNIENITVADAADAIQLVKRTNIFSNELFQQGHFELQDGGSQLVAPFLDVKPGMRVIDACAGAGGKALHLGALMKNKGRIIAMDVEDYKLAELRKRARRNEISIIETRLIENNKAIKHLKESADRLLLDVPCTGSGVLRRNPDAKYKIDRDFINRMQTQQQEILQQYVSMLKTGGKLVYATCSIFPAENEHQVQRFLQANPNYELENEMHILPSKSDFDGFYCARIMKK